MSNEAIEEMLKRLKELLAETNNRLSVFVGDDNGHVSDVRKYLEEIWLKTPSTN